LNNLPDPGPPQIRQGDHDDRHDAQDHSIRMERWQRRRQRVDAGRSRHGHGQDVVDQQRCGSGQRRRQAEVVLGDEIGAASLGIGVHGLAVRDDDNRQEQGDAKRDRQRITESGAAGEDQNQENLFGRVRHRRQQVGREHRQRDRLAQPFVPRLGQRHRRADQQPLDRLHRMAVTSLPGLRRGE
jgi:hypothetical protein